MTSAWTCNGVRCRLRCTALFRVLTFVLASCCVIVCQHGHVTAFFTPHLLGARPPATGTSTAAESSRDLCRIHLFASPAQAQPSSERRRWQQRDPLARKSISLQRQHIRSFRSSSRRSLSALAMRTTQREETRHSQFEEPQQQPKQGSLDVNSGDNAKANRKGERKGKGGSGKDEDAVGEQKSVLGKAGDAAKTAFNAIMAAGTLASVILAAETIWELHGTPLTFSNAVPTLTKLLPLTGIGVFGAAQLVGLLARVVRVIVTLPIMVSGTWVIVQNLPQLLPKGADLSGAGSLAAILATPEVLEAAAVLAFLAGMVLWTLNFARGALAALTATAASRQKDDYDA